ncbi:energy transducer TonB [Hymenobacter sp.]|uniref:energy transducer TonB n=1 Tax=Hymenobacter sp. TaxID=1898978 RepID=UPI00286AC5BC|nr:energy transducer TonB [Hymenobacter sp.]
MPIGITSLAQHFWSITPGLGVVATQPAFAQANTPSAPLEQAKGPVYTRVEQMPQLPGGGDKAIVSAIQNRVIYPPEALKIELEGRVFVAFPINPNGAVSDARIVEGIGMRCDEAVLAAVRQLPQFVPGMQSGKPVAVTYTAPITFSVSNSWSTR